MEWWHELRPNGSLCLALSLNLDCQKCRFRQLLLYYLPRPHRIHQYGIDFDLICSGLMIAFLTLDREQCLNRVTQKHSCMFDSHNRFSLTKLSTNYFFGLNLYYWQHTLSAPQICTYCSNRKRKEVPGAYSAFSLVLLLSFFTGKEIWAAYPTLIGQLCRSRQK